jgi:hypothetical protein
MLEKTTFAEKAVAQRPPGVILPPIPLTISTMIHTPDPEVVVIGNGNFESQQIVTASTRAWTSQGATAGDSEKSVDSKH